MAAAASLRFNGTAWLKFEDENGLWGIATVSALRHVIWWWGGGGAGVSAGRDREFCQLLAVSATAATYAACMSAALCVLCVMLCVCVFC